MNSNLEAILSNISFGIHSGNYCNGGIIKGNSCGSRILVRWDQMIFFVFC